MSFLANYLYNIVLSKEVIFYWRKCRTSTHPAIKTHNLILCNRLLVTQISINLCFYIIDDCFWDFVMCKLYNIVLTIDPKSFSGKDQLCCQNRYRQCCQHVMKPPTTTSKPSTHKPTTSTETATLLTTTKPIKPPKCQLCKISIYRCN